jgi:PKD repeat protein
VESGIGVGFGAIPYGQDVTVQAVVTNDTAPLEADRTTYVLFDYEDPASYGSTPLYRRVSLKLDQFNAWMTPAAVDDMQILVVPDPDNPLSVEVSVFGVPASDETVQMVYGDSSGGDEAPAADPTVFAHTYDTMGDYILVARAEPSGSQVTSTVKLAAEPATLTVDVTNDENTAEGGCLVKLNGASGASASGVAFINWGDETDKPSKVVEFDESGTLTTSLHHRYARPGSYLVEVGIMDSVEWGFAVVEVTQEPPTELKIVGTGTAEVGVAYPATVYGLTPDTEWQMDFGTGQGAVDMGLAPLEAPGMGLADTEVFTEPGYYTIVATQGDELRGVQNVTVTSRGAGGSLIVVAAADPVAPLSVQATVQGASDGQTVTVDWGDGGATDSQMQNGGAELVFTHVYASEGTYTISATSDVGGAGSATITLDESDVVSHPLTITATPGEEEPEHYTVTVNGAEAGDTVTLEWGDSSTADSGIQPDDESEGVEFTHTYTESGTFTLTASATNSSDSATTQINVAEASTFSFDDLDGGDGIENDESLDNGGGLVTIPWRSSPDVEQVSVTLDWGDDSEPTAVNMPPFDPAADVTGDFIAHRYAEPGTYTVTLTNADGSWGEGEVTVTQPAPESLTIQGPDSGVTDTPTATWEVQGVFPGETAEVKYGDGGGAVSLEPSVHDYGTVQVPEHQYRAAGKKTLTVTQDDATGTATITITNDAT